MPQTLTQVDLVLFSFLHSFDASIVSRGSQASLTTRTSQSSQSDAIRFPSSSHQTHQTGLPCADTTRSGFALTQQFTQEEVDASSLASRLGSPKSSAPSGALERLDAAWSKGEEHMAKLSVNAMIGLWARSTEVVYSVRSSSSELTARARTSLRPSPTRGAWCGTSSTPGGC